MPAYMLRVIRQLAWPATRATSVESSFQVKKGDQISAAHGCAGGQRALPRARSPGIDFGLRGVAAASFAACTTLLSPRTGADQGTTGSFPRETQGVPLGRCSG